VSEALAALEGRAICEGPQVKLELRTAKHKGWFLYDLGDGQNVKTGKSGWNIVEATPIFRRYSHQQAQVEPKRGGNPWDVFDFINIAKEHQLKTLVLLISYLVPGIAHPVFHPHGAHGSGKTTLCTMIKDLLDPSSLSVMIAPKNKQELIRQIHRHYISLFDNMSKLDSEMSDIICVACTGGSVAKRTLYTDDDDSIFNFKRCIGLNGINLLISKPDLLDRSMLLHLERIQAQDRKLEAKLLAEFSEAKPAILGGMFDILSKAKSLYSIKKPINKPRLADFATWGYAIAEALEKGYGKKFVAAYQANIKRQNTEVLQGNSLCIAVTQLLKSEPEWEGTIKEAYKKLFDIVEPVKTDGTFPTNERQLRRHLERIQTTLAEAVGITYCISEKPKNNGFHIVFVKK
jgi:energy-coupling factor transporter ATP-binding protein EcfA2